MPKTRQYVHLNICYCIPPFFSEMPFIEIWSPCPCVRVAILYPYAPFLKRLKLKPVTLLSASFEDIVNLHSYRVVVQGCRKQ